MKLLGVKQIVITNLAGAINKEYEVESLCRVTKHHSPENIVLGW